MFRERMKICLAVLLVLATVLGSAVILAEERGTLRLQIVDSEGAAIEAHVVIRPDGAGRHQPKRASDIAADGDKAGRLTLELEPGFYDVCVMADAFIPVCQKVRLMPNAVKAIKTRLKIDSNIIREFGDRF